MVPQAYREIRK